MCFKIPTLSKEKFDPIQNSKTKAIFGWKENEKWKRSRKGKKKSKEKKGTKK